MSDEKLPEVVTDFIAAHIDSALQLEILLFLRTAAEKHWTAAEVDVQLRSNRQWVAEQLADLCRRGLLICNQENPPAYNYSPADEKLASAVNELATWYSTHRVALISEIYSKPTENLRTFANAFRLRKDKPNG